MPRYRNNIFFDYGQTNYANGLFFSRAKTIRFTPPWPPSRGESLVATLRGGGNGNSRPRENQDGLASSISHTNYNHFSNLLNPKPQQESPPRGNFGALAKSLIIPGWGQYSLGAKTSARNFLIAEILLIGGSIGFHVYGNWLEDDFVAFAAQHAGLVSADGKDERFWVDIGNFDSIGAFNQEKLRQRSPGEQRDPNGDDYWQWDSRENRRVFEDLRIRRDRADERSTFLIAGIVTNHIVSAIHTMWVARRNAKNGTASTQPKYRFVWENTSSGDGGRLKFSYRF